MELEELEEIFRSRPDRLRIPAKASKEFKTGSLLELGCGCGEASAFFREAGFVVTGVDISNEKIAYAKRTYEKPGLSFVCADAAELPFIQQSFDAVFLEATFSSLKDKSRSCSELARIMSPEAMLIVCDYILPDRTEEAEGSAPALSGACTETEYRHLFQSAGFQSMVFDDEYSTLVQIVLHLCKCLGVNYYVMSNMLGIEARKKVRRYGYKYMRFIRKKGV